MGFGLWSPYFGLLTHIFDTERHRFGDSGDTCSQGLLRCGERHMLRDAALTNGPCRCREWLLYVWCVGGVTLDLNLSPS